MRKTFDTLDAEWQSAVLAIGASTDVLVLVRRVEAARCFMEAVMCGPDSPFRVTGNGAADLQLMGGCLRQLVGELVDSPNALLARELAARVGVREEDAKVALYYLTKFGVLERERCGRTFAHRLASTQLRAGVVAREWSSIQPRKQHTDSPAIADT